jgi:hypothetical protein
MKMFHKLGEYRKTVLSVPFLLLIIIAATVLSSVAVTWSNNETRLTTYRGFDGLPSISQTVDGKIWIAWTRNAIDDFSIVYQTSSDLGASWSPETILTTDAGTDISPSIFQDMNGSIWVVWSSDRTGGFDLYYKTSSDNGLTWSNATRLTTDPSDDLSPTATQTMNGSIWVVWSSDRTGGFDLYYKTSSDNGLTWSNATRLTTDPNPDKLPSIAQTSDGNIWVSWSSNRLEDYEIFYKTYNGLSWSNETNLTVDPNIDTDPSILQTLDGTTWIFWSRRNVTPEVVEGELVYCEDLYYKYSCENGITWSDSIQFTFTDIYTVVEDGYIIVCYNDDTWSTVMQARDTSIWVAWTSNRTDQTDGDWEIYFRASLAGDVNEDGAVDIFDLSAVAKAYASVVGGPEYDPDLDITKDGRVDMRDIAIISKHYGST